jgi:signal transduction histidine kinase
MIGKAAKTRKTVISSTLDKDEGITRQAVVEAGFKQIVCLPLMALGEVVGVLSIATRSRKEITQAELQLLESVAAWAGIAMENARLHYNARRLAVLEERDRIGMDLHDGIIQSIYAVGLTLEDVRADVLENPAKANERLGKAMDDLNHTIRDIRNYILDLRPRQLSGGTLIEGLTRLVTEFRQNSSIEATLAGPKGDTISDMPPTHALTLFHICQEALANTAKHSNAAKVGVELWATTDRVLLEVHDDGRGFNLQNTNQTMGHGLANMHTRVTSVGGDLDINSAPGEGTTILAWVPRIESPKPA